MEIQCHFIVLSADEYARITQLALDHRAGVEAAKARQDFEWVRNNRRMDHHEEIHRLWLALQGIVVAAANVSKLLWGSGRDTAKTARQRKPLRDALGVTESSPLKDVTLRNQFEHYDEKLEKWSKETAGTGEPYVSRNIGSWVAIAA